MQQKLFFENIEQAVCLITKCSSNTDSVKDYDVYFNLAFRQTFTKVSKSSLFEEFKFDFEQYVQILFGQNKPDFTLEFLLFYLQKQYKVLPQKLEDNIIVFLFKEHANLSAEPPFLFQESDIIDKFGKMNFNTSTFDDASSMIYVTDIGGKVEYSNKKFTQVTGFSLDEIRGKKTNFLKSAKQGADFYKNLWDTILAGQIWSNSLHNKKKSGQFYWQRSQIIPLRNNYGDIYRFLAIADDITEDKAIETVLEEKSDILYQLVEGIPDIVCIKDGEGRWLMANAAHLGLFELEHINYYGKTDAELAEFTSFHRNNLLKCEETDNRSWQSATMLRGDEKIALSNGEERILEKLKIPIFNADGSRKMLILIGRDITIRKKALENLTQVEKRFALAQKSSGMLSWEWDLDSLRLNWAENLEEIFNKAHLFDNKDFGFVMKHIHSDDRSLFLRKMLRAVRKHEEYDFEMRVYDADQNIKWVHHSGIIHFDELKGKSLLIGIVYDISERKNYVGDLLTAKLRAEESDLLKSTFLATMSHELRTPLNAVIGFSDLILSDTNLEAETAEFVRLINNNGQSLLSLIEDIFDLSLIESHQVKIYNEKFDLVQLLEELAEVVPIEIRKFNKTADIEFINELPDTEIILNSDANRINQIISNLLKNAIKFTPKGFVKLGIKEEQDDVIIFVEDNGIGISEAKQELIFEIFRQVEESLTRQFGGAGLGLSLSHNLAHLLGGKLWVDSKEGEGSVFSFKIKRDKAESILQIQTEGKNQIMDWKDKYILIAEDEFSNYELLMYILKPTKARLKQVTNGNDAIDEVLNKERPDLILMDIKMPELNGFEATKRIKEVYPDLPIIAQTAFAISGDREMALAMGCDEYISKPIKKLELLELMKKYLG